jgi:ribosomal protein S18 acetylase RimI-like enzyme
MPTVPHLAGPVVAWRPATLTDAPALTDLFNASKRADGMPDEVRSVEEITHELEDPGTHLEADTQVGLGRDGRLLAWGSVWCRITARHLARAVIFGDVHPEARRQGVGRALLAWELARADDRLATELDPTLPRRVDLYASDVAAGRAALARSAGMTPVRWFSKMTRSLTEPVAHADVPAGLEMIAWADDRSDASLDALNDAWRDHWGYEPMPPEVWRYRTHEDAAFLAPASRLAVDDDQVAGLVLCSEQAAQVGDEGRTAWLDLIAVRRAWRKRGVASALIAASLVALADEGFRTAALDVDSASPTGALGVYERHGFRVKRTETVYALERDAATR